jgi:hypothetical protein
VDPSVLPYALFVKTWTDVENQTYQVYVYNSSEQAMLNSTTPSSTQRVFLRYIRMPSRVQSGDTLTFTITAKRPLSEDGTATDANGRNQLMTSISPTSSPSLRQHSVGHPLLDADRDTVYRAKSFFDGPAPTEDLCDL